MSGRGGHGGGEGGRKKRAKPDEGSWDCTVCTFHNTADAFKCLMCDTRKGTSTRKPKLNSHLEEQVEQVVRQLSAHQTKKPRLSLNRDAPSPPSPPSPFDFDDRPSSSSNPGIITSVKGKGIGKNKKGGVGKKATIVTPIVDDDEDEDCEREEDDEEELVKEEKKKKTTNAGCGKSAIGKTMKGSAAIEKIEKFEKSEKTEKKTPSIVAKKEKEPKLKTNITVKKDEDGTSSMTAMTTDLAGKMGKKSEQDEPEPKRRLHRLKNVDRSTANSMAVTVNNITVIITDFKPKIPSDVSTQSEKKTKAES